MPSLIVSLVFVPTLLVVVLLLRRLSFILRPIERHNGVPRPPFIVNWMPFLGNALDMASGDQFWEKAQCV